MRWRAKHLVHAVRSHVEPGREGAYERRPLYDAESYLVPNSYSIVARSVTAGPDQACAGALAFDGKWHPQEREHSDAEAARGTECSDETG